MFEFELVKKEEDIKPDFGPVGSVVDIRTYRRWLPNKKRRETFVERNTRVVDANLDLVKDIITDEEYNLERSIMLDHMNKLLALPSGRSMWIAGTEANKKHPASSFNCSALAINRIEAFTTVFELLMLGTGVGFRVFSSDINKLPNINKFDIEFEEYKAKDKKDRLEDTTAKTYYVPIEHTRYLCEKTYIEVGDSRKGWIDALLYLLNAAFAHDDCKKIVFNFNSVRPLGERINGFGGTASGHEALKTLLQDVFDIINQCPSDKLRSIDCLDICCAIAKGVVAGNTRRSALLCLFEEGDDLLANAKVNLFDDPKLKGKYYRIQSNNTEALGTKHLSELREFLEANPDVTKEELWKFIDAYKPSVEWLKERFKVIANAGDPGFANYLKMVGKKWLAVRKYRPDVTVKDIWQWFCDLCSNPCHRGDMKLLTTEGYKTFEELNGTEPYIINKDGNITKSKVWCSGTKEIFEVALSNKSSIFCTEDHVYLTSEGESKAIDLKGKHLVPFLKKPINHSLELVLLGFTLGDGNLTIPSKSRGELLNIGSKDLDIFTLIKEAGYSYDKSFTNSTCGYYVNELDKLVEEYKINRVVSPERELPNSYYNLNKLDKAAFLCGLYSANGSFTKGHGRVTFKTASKVLAEQLLSTLKEDFHLSSVYITTNKSKAVEFSNGIYQCKESYDVNIARYKDKLEFFNTINFYHTYKTEMLFEHLTNQSPFVTSVKSVGYDKVYDFTEPETNWGVVEGFISHNCFEIVLSVGYMFGLGVGFCNLTTLPINKFVIKKCNNNDMCAITGYKLDEAALEQAIRLTVRMGTRQTFVTMPRSELDDTQKAERLLGVSITGWIQLFAKLDLSYAEQEQLMKQINGWANNEADIYSAKLRVERPLMVCCVKPEGCLEINHLRTTTEGLLRVDEIGDVSKLGFNSIVTNNKTTSGYSINKVYNNGLSQVVEIILNNGRKLTSTLQHPFSVNGLWKNAVNLQIGDVLDIKLDTYNKTTNELLAQCAVKYNHLREEDIVFPISTSNNLAWWVSTIFANGSINSGTISLCSGYIEVVQKFIDITKELFNITCIAKKDNTKDMYRTTISSSDLINFLTINGLLKTKDFSIPLIIRRSSKDCILSFICGYLDNDGCFKNDGCTITTKNETFARMFQEVTEAVGLSFSCYKYTRETTKGSGTYCDLQLSRSYSTKEAIDFINTHSIKANINNPIVISDRIHKNPYKVKSVIILDDLINTYDIEVSDPHWYYQGGIKSHNTGSKVLGSSSGVHWDWAPYYINRIQMGANDALAKTLKQQGFSWIPTPYDLSKIYPTVDIWQAIELFRQSSLEEKEVAFNSSNAVLFEFPINSGMVESQGSVSASRQLQNVLRFSDKYVDHMVSSTITAKEDEWDSLAEELHAEKNWSRFTNAAFLSYYSGNHPLFPNDQITEDEYNNMMASFKDSDWVKDGRFYVNEELLAKLEQEALGIGVDIDDVDLGSACSTSACPIR
jgi:ribonucleotide reductase alpha subunit